MNGVLVSTLVRLSFSGTALKPPRIFMYLSLQQFILSNLVLVLRRPWQVLRPSRLVLRELRSSFRVSRTRSVTVCKLAKPFSRPRRSSRPLSPSSASTSASPRNLRQPAFSSPIHVLVLSRRSHLPGDEPRRNGRSQRLPPTPESDTGCLGGTTTTTRPNCRSRGNDAKNEPSFGPPCVP